ncbi:MAG: ABC-2 transporter permease, partial [Clostridiales bacterium]|nr:ABC-2 transporter permease [Clostridiales bacterium]
MINSLKMAKLDFFTMKSQLASYMVIIFLVLFFGFMDASIIMICVNCAWFMALMSTMIFATQEKNNLNRLYGSLSLKLKDIVLGRYIFTVISFVLSFMFAVALFFGFTLLNPTFDRLHPKNHKKCKKAHFSNSRNPENSRFLSFESPE